MTPQEKDMIAGLIQRVQQTQLPDKDIEAESFLQQNLGRNPDALYILAQTVLVQKFALDQAQAQLTQAKAQIEQMQQQAPSQQPQKHTSFLGSLLGMDNSSQSAPPPPAQSAPQNQGYAPVPNTGSGYPQGGYAAPQQGYGQAGYAPAAPTSPFGGGGGFMRGAMQTAAGVAAGALAFEGVESLVHGFEHLGGGGGGERGFGDLTGGAGGGREEVINNYYGDSGDADKGGRLDRAEDSRQDQDDSGRFADVGSDDTDSYTDDSTDDNSDDDSSFA